MRCEFITADAGVGTSVAVLPVYEDGTRGCLVELAANDQLCPHDILTALDAVCEGESGRAPAPKTKTRETWEKWNLPSRQPAEEEEGEEESVRGGVSNALPFCKTRQKVTLNACANHDRPWLIFTWANSQLCFLISRTRSVCPPARDSRSACGHVAGFQQVGWEFRAVIGAWRVPV